MWNAISFKMLFNLKRAMEFCLQAIWFAANVKKKQTKKQKVNK